MTQEEWEQADLDFGWGAVFGMALVMMFTLCSYLRIPESQSFWLMIACWSAIVLSTPPERLSWRMPAGLFAGSILGFLTMWMIIMDLQIYFFRTLD